ncbi:MAG: ribonuclease R [Nevskia sp.]|nr:ribonuclease R [Nevskia sp.]
MKRDKNRRRQTHDDKLEAEPSAPGHPKGVGTDWRGADPEHESEAARYASPLPSRTLVLNTLGQAAEPLTLDELIAHFGLRKLSEQEAFAKRLAAMAREGQIYPADLRGAYRAVETGPASVPVAEDLAEHKSARRPQRAAPHAPRAAATAGAADLVEGRVTVHRDGYGFLASDSGGPDVFLPPRQVKGLMHGDRARVRVTGADARGRREGALVEVIERGTTRVVGRLQGSHGVFTVIPSNPRTPEVIIPAADLGGAAHGQVVVAELTAPPNERSLPMGRVTEILGDHLAPGMEIQAAIRAHDLPNEWPEAVLRAAQAFPKEVQREQVGRRVDLRELGLVTIDGADARDFDDAVFAQKSSFGRGWKLWVAIADVSAYVVPGTPLDAEAQNRGTSVYFPDNVIPMLPEALSNGLCSLNPDVDRLCMVCEMQVGTDGEVGKSRFYEAVMRSHARLVYEEAAAILEDPKAAAKGPRAALVKPLQNLQGVFNALFKARERRGAIDFESSETKIVFGAGRKIEKIVPVQRTLAHRLIEECMIAANVEAARLVEKHGVPTLYRVHAEPDADKVALLREFLAGRGLQLAGGASPKAGDYARALAQIQGREDAGVVQDVMLRSLMQARYSPDNTGHFGLALTHYGHFTSPIRRYPDLLLHRAIKHVLARGTPAEFGYAAEQMVQLGAHCSMAERRADEATRDVNTWLKCEFMRHRVGDEFTGVVISVLPFGLFVELEDLFIEGLVHVSNLQGDYYEFDPRHHRLVGNRSKKAYGLGDELRVRVTRVSLDERKIDLEVVAPGQAPRGAGEQRRQAASQGKGRGRGAPPEGGGKSGGRKRRR